MTTVLFCGAGFSAAFGLPTMNQFFSVAYASERLSEEEKNLLRQIQQEARAANAFRESSPTNLEDILTLAVMGDWLGLNSEADRGSKIQRILAKIYTRPSSPADEFWAGHDGLAALLGDSDPDGNRLDLSLITTNYDVLLECSAYRAGWRCHLAGIKGDSYGYGNTSVEGNLYNGRVPIFKLHGSVNWFTTPDSEELIVEGRVVNLNPSVNRKTGKMVLNGAMPLVCVDDYKPHPKGVPLLVPPTFMKPVNERVLQGVWQGAAKALAEAERLVFIGYSFPPTDTVMGYFLARSLEKNVKLSKIAVVDQNANAIVSRLRSPDSGFGSHFRALLEAHECKSWTDFNMAHFGFV